MLIVLVMTVGMMTFPAAWTLDTEEQNPALSDEEGAGLTEVLEVDEEIINSEPDNQETADDMEPASTDGEEHVHHFAAAETVGPTCTEKGYTLYVCACGEDSYYADETDPLGHDWDEGVLLIEATTDTEGSMIYTCQTCGEQKTEAIPKLDDTPEEEQADQEDADNKQKEEEKTPEKPVSDPTADLEYKDFWDSLFDDAELTGEWAHDLLIVAESQIGYCESGRNFEAELNGEGTAYILHGWTRYGAWYGIPYGDWCAMFISFCLHYAGIAQDDFPYDCGTRTWIVSLSERDLYRNAEDYTPKPGDLIFYDWEGDKLSDHVGIVYDVDEERNELTTIEGNQGDAVRKCDYSMNDGHILGYGLLPVNPELNKTRGIKGRASLRGDDSSKLQYIDVNGVQQYREVFEVFEGVLEGGEWYAVQGTNEAERLIIASGEVNLVLCDDSVLTVEHGILVSHGASLNIWAQKNCSGQLIAGVYSDEGNSAFGGSGIGGDRASSEGCGDISINGGHITAVGASGASGIGGSGTITINGGADGSRTFVTASSVSQGVAIGGNGGSGTVTINGGTVNAAGGSGGAGIGGSGRDVVINNGIVNASGGLYGAGIGGSSNGSNGSIIINGGYVSATAINPSGEAAQFRNKAAAIGAGAGYAQSGSVRINGGTVFAKSYGMGAGIGGAEDGDGNGCAGGVIEINGAETNVVAMSVYGAGIGSGGADPAVSYAVGAAGGTITVNEGFVFALSSAAGAGIGGGNRGSGGAAVINGGCVIASGGSPYYSQVNSDIIPYGGIVLSGDAVDGYMEETLCRLIAYEVRDLLFSHSYGGAGIGGGDNGNGGNVSVNGGITVAKGGSNSCAAVGWGSGTGYDAGSLGIYDYAKVSYGSLDETGNTAVTGVESYNPDDDRRATRAMTNPYARIEPGEVTVSFEVGEHGTSPLSQSFTMGGTVSKPEDPAEDGWFFTGWYKDADCTDAFHFNESINTNITLYAKWIRAYALAITKIWPEGGYTPETAVITYSNSYSADHVTEGTLTLCADNGWTGSVFVSTESTLTFTEEPIDCFQAAGWKLYAGDTEANLPVSESGAASLNLKEQSTAVLEAVKNGNAELAVTNVRTGYMVKKEWEAVPREYSYTDNNGTVQLHSFEWPAAIDHIYVVLQHREGEAGDTWETVETLELKSSEQWTGAFSTPITDSDSSYRIRELLTDEERNDGYDGYDLPEGMTESIVFDAEDADGNGKTPKFVYHHTEREFGGQSFDGAFTVSYDWDEDGSYVITNRLTGSIFVETIWEIDENETLKPTGIEVVLQHYETEEGSEEKSWVTVESKELNEENGWEGRFDCAIVDPDEITDYRIRELDEDGIVIESTDETDSSAEFEISGGDDASSVRYAVSYEFDNSSSTTRITNTAVKDIDVRKHWVTPAGSEKPQSITVLLMADGNEAERKTLTEEDGWSCRFSSKPIYRDGEEISYSVLEEPVVGYSAETDAFDITNTMMPTYVELGAYKTMSGQSLRAGAYSFQLRDPYGRLLQTKTNDAGGNVVFDRIYFTSDDLLRDEEGKPIETKLAYTIREVEAVNELSYDKHIETVIITLRDNGNGTISAEADKSASQVRFANELEKILLTVKAEWADKEAHSTKIPPSVTVHLFADGKLIRSTGLTESGNWTCSFGEYNKYDSQHKEIKYTLTEDIVQNWVRSVKMKDGQFTVTNTYTEKTYTITYKTNGGVWSSGGSEDRYDTHVITEGATIIKAPTRRGYAFIEWKGSSYQPGDAYHEKDSQGYFVSDTLVAQWKRSPSTGDLSNTRFWIGLAACSASALICSLAVLSRRKKRKS